MKRPRKSTKSGKPTYTVSTNKHQGLKKGPSARREQRKASSGERKKHPTTRTANVFFLLFFFTKLTLEISQHTTRVADGDRATKAGNTVVVGSCPTVGATSTPRSAVASGNQPGLRNRSGTGRSGWQSAGSSRGRGDLGGNRRDLVGGLPDRAVPHRFQRGRAGPGQWRLRTGRGGGGLGARRSTRARRRTWAEV
jgi:hypothetical protein